jgi:hypothetical protein
MNFLMIVPMTVYNTCFFNHTRGRILLAAAFHLTFNIVNMAIVPLTSMIAPFIGFIAVQWVIALFLIRRYGPQTLAQYLRSDERF